mmetsp:Transcript_28786/g.73672  ORF Transcript_28786/g.73672 Transcript_28786/m.73672 type:complete len:269 (+) Transcript_28786:5647-6453(+)
MCKFLRTVPSKFATFPLDTPMPTSSHSVLEALLNTLRAERHAQHHCLPSCVRQNLESVAKGDLIDDTTVGAVTSLLQPVAKRADVILFEFVDVAPYLVTPPDKPLLEKEAEGYDWACMITYCYGHWYFMALSLEEKRAIIYDSMMGSKPIYTNIANRFYRLLHSNIEKGDVDISVMKVPRQTGSTTCGLHAIVYLYCFIFGLSPSMPPAAINALPNQLIDALFTSGSKRRCGRERKSPPAKAAKKAKASSPHGSNKRTRSVDQLLRKQ